MVAKIIVFIGMDRDTILCRQDGYILRILECRYHVLLVMEEETAEVQRSLMVESPDLNDYTRKMQTLLQLIDADKLSPRLRAAVELQAELFFNRLPPMVITGDMNDYTDNVKRS